MTVRYQYSPKWRKGAPVEYVTDPDAAWFASLRRWGDENGSDDERRGARFALMTDGTLYFGDAYDVVHWDICQCRGAQDERPLYVGILVQVDGEWRRGLTQLFGHGYEDDASRWLSRLLPRMENWRAVVAALGGKDPMLLGMWQEAAGRFADSV